MKSLGLCFLIYDKINHEELWYNWLKNVDDKKYKIYIHYKNDSKLKYFEKYKLNNCIFQNMKIKLYQFLVIYYLEKRITMRKFINF